MSKSVKKYTFTDNEGDEWGVAVHFETVAAIEDALEVKFADMADDNGPLMRMLNDYMFCFRCLFVACESQCKARGVDSKGFSKRIVGDAFTLAQDALINAVIAFFPNPERRDAAVDLVRRMRNAEALLTRKARQELESLDMDRLTDQMLGIESE